MFSDDYTPKSPADLGQGRLKPAADIPEEREPGSPNLTPRSPHSLDSPDNDALHRRLLAHYQRELERQSENRAEQARDEDYYDNEQWDAADAAQLRERGQMPLVYNVISSTINWVTGTEKRGRSDYRVLPRRKDAARAAERKSQLLKYLSDVNRSNFHVSRAFEDSVKTGVGWIETGVQEADDGEPVYERYESWRNMLWDSACTELDLADARYVFRTKWVDLDVAIAKFPDRKAALEEAAVDGERLWVDFDNGDGAMDAIENAMHHATTGLDSWAYERRRVRLIEAWFRQPTETERVRGGDFSGEVFDPHSPGHVEQVETGQAQLIRRQIMRVHVAIMTTSAMLYVSESPYRHNQFPFTPLWCYRRGRDGMPYGMIRGMRDIQNDINKRASKALHILSTNKVIMDAGAVEDLDEFADEVSRPDAIIVKQPGKELVLNAERELAPAHLDLMSRSIMMIQSQSGVTDEAMGRTTNATAGIAIQRRQEQAGMATAGIFDRLRLAKQVHGEKALSLVEQFFTEQKQFRITNLRGNPEYITINDGLPENDIARSRADYVISEADWRASVRQAQVEELLQLLAQVGPVAPQLALTTLDLIVEAMDIPAREELVKRIRQVTGMRDPDAEEPTPEEIAQAQEQQRQQQIQERAIMARIAKDEAQAQKAAADAQAVQVKAQQALASLAGTNVATQRAALETALAMLSAPPAVPVADRVLHEAGFTGRTEQEEEARHQGIIEGEAMAAQQEQQAMLQQQQMAEQQAIAEQQAQQQQVQDDMKHMDPVQREAVEQAMQAQQQQQSPQPPME